MTCERHHHEKQPAARCHDLAYCTRSLPEKFAQVFAYAYMATNVRDVSEEGNVPLFCSKNRLTD